MFTFAAVAGRGFPFGPVGRHNSLRGRFGPESVKGNI